ncbi:hypothetical protein [Pseudorhodobacter ferrugineus]|nr:hypothetical protein [Pseudorhodobacter ferrugineus]
MSRKSECGRLTVLRNGVAVDGVVVRAEFSQAEPYFPGLFCRFKPSNQPKFICRIHSRSDSPDWHL